MKLIYLLAATAVACSAILTVCGCNRSSVSAFTENAQSATAGTLDRVSVGRSERKTLALHTSQPGRVEAFEETPLYPKVTGYVEEVLVDIGDMVKKDQVLIKLWIPEMQDAREQKEALVAQSEAEIKQAEVAVQAAKAGVITAQAHVSQAAAGIGRADGENDRWNSEHERIKELAEKGSVTPKLVAETRNQLRAAEAARGEAVANVESAKASLNEAEVNVSKAQADLVAAQAEHRVAQSNLKQSTTMLGYAQIKAPFDGVVTRRVVDTGHYVHPANGAATQPLLVVANTDEVRIFVDVPEMEAPLVDGGDMAVIRVQSLRNQEFKAAVTRSGWSLDAANRSIRAEIDIPNKTGLLRPGMYVTVTILLDERSDALVLPVSAIVRDGQNSYCCCVESGQIVRKQIVLGLRSGSEVEVLSGLSGSESIVLAQADALQPGQQVEVIQTQK